MCPDTLAPCRGRRPHNIDNSEGRRRGRAVLLMDFWNICLQLAEGMLTSLAIFALTLIFSLPLGLLVAFARKSKHAWLRVPVKVYISVMRGTPLMLQLLIVYFGPYLIFGAKLSADYRFPATIIALSVNYAAYFAEIFRSGIESVPAGQYEAAQVLGLSRRQCFFRVIFPQVIKRVLPPVTNEVITLVKDTSLAYAIAVTEMFTLAKQIAAAESSLLPYLAAGIFYYIFNFLVAFAMERAERAFDYYQTK